LIKQQFDKIAIACFKILKMIQKREISKLKIPILSKIWFNIAIILD